MPESDSPQDSLASTIEMMDASGLLQFCDQLSQSSFAQRTDSRTSNEERFTCAIPEKSVLSQITYMGPNTRGIFFRVAGVNGRSYGVVVHRSESRNQLERTNLNTFVAANRGMASKTIRYTGKSEVYILKARKRAATEAMKEREYHTHLGFRGTHQTPRSQKTNIS